MAREASSQEIFVERDISSSGSVKDPVIIPEEVDEEGSWPVPHLEIEAIIQRTTPKSNRIQHLLEQEDRAREKRARVVLQDRVRRGSHLVMRLLLDSGWVRNFHEDLMKWYSLDGLLKGALKPSEPISSKKLFLAKFACKYTDYVIETPSEWMERLADADAIEGIKLETFFVQEGVLQLLNDVFESKQKSPRVRNVFSKNKLAALKGLRKCLHPVKYRSRRQLWHALIGESERSQEKKLQKRTFGLWNTVLDVISALNALRKLPEVELPFTQELLDDARSRIIDADYSPKDLDIPFLVSTVISMLNGFREFEQAEMQNSADSERMTLGEALECLDGPQRSDFVPPETGKKMDFDLMEFSEEEEVIAVIHDRPEEMDSHPDSDKRVIANEMLAVNEGKGGSPKAVPRSNFRKKIKGDSLRRASEKIRERLRKRKSGKLVTEDEWRVFRKLGFSLNADRPAVEC